MAYLGMTISALTMNFLIASIGMGFTFLSFAAANALLTVYVWACLPETRNKTEAEKDALFASTNAPTAAATDPGKV